MSSTTEQEIRREFERWFQAAAAKDIDGVMSHMADDVISYYCNEGFQITDSHPVPQ